MTPTKNRNTTKHTARKQTLTSIQVREGNDWIEVCKRSGREIQTVLRRLTKAGWVARAV